MDEITPGSSLTDTVPSFSTMFHIPVVPLVVTYAYWSSRQDWDGLGDS